MFNNNLIFFQLTQISLSDERVCGFHEDVDLRCCQQQTKRGIAEKRDTSARKQGTGGQGFCFNLSFLEDNI